MAHDLANTLTLITAHAKALRDAGVASLTVGDVAFTLHPPTIEEVAPVAVEAPKQVPGALDDPASYGWPEGSPLPGFKRPGKD